MTAPETSFSVRVDLTNPGQFLACCGLLELAHRLWPGAEGWFEGESFVVGLPCKEASPLGTILERLGASAVKADETRGDKSTRPVQLEGFALTLDWWIDHTGEKTSLKLWAGQQTSLTIVETLQPAVARLAEKPTDGILDVGEPLTGRYGFDPRSAWNTLDVGFSPNEQGMAVDTFAAVELLAAVGLQGFRPVPNEGRRWRYVTWDIPLAAPIARAACAAAIPVRGASAYQFRVASRGSYKGFSYATSL